jgi:hypothetical protein
MPDTGLLQPRSRRRVLTVAACSAVVQIVAVLAGLWVVLHYIQTHIATQPLLLLLFPPLAVSGRQAPMVTWLVLDLTVQSPTWLRL